MMVCCISFHSICISFHSITSKVLLAQPQLSLRPSHSINLYFHLP
jgi:hypothetical protein